MTEDDDTGAAGSLRRAGRRGYSHSRMWTQYAAGQTGVCLVFDRAELISSGVIFGDRLMQDPVKYVPEFDEALYKAELIRNDRLDPTWHHQEAVLPSLLVKNDDWQSEREYRFIVDDWGIEACLLPIESAIKGLALGSGFMRHNLPVAEAIATKFALGDSVAHMMLHSGVLAPLPSRQPDGSLCLWTDAETRSPSAWDLEDL